MLKLLSNIANDLRYGKYLESYIVITLALIVVVLDIFDLAKQSWISEITLAVLALLIYSRIQLARTVDKVDSSIRNLNTGHRFEKSNEVSLLEVGKRIEAAQTIDWVAFTHHRTIRLYNEALKKCLSRGGSIRILLIDPKDDVCKFVARNSYTKITNEKKYYSEQVTYTLERCKQIVSEAGRGSIEVRFLRIYPPFRMTVYNRVGGKGYIRIHLLKAPNTSDAATIAWHKEDDPLWFEFFVDEYEKLWKRSFAADGIGEKENYNVTNASVT